MATNSNKLSVYDGLAAALLALYGEGLIKKRLKSYVVLECKLGKSDRNKNAVSVIREGITFMVGDWASATRADELKIKFGILETKKLGKRLRFPGLGLSEIQEHQEFMRDLVREAKQQSEWRQTH